MLCSTERERQSTALNSAAPRQLNPRDNRDYPAPKQQALLANSVRTAHYHVNLIGSWSVTAKGKDSYSSVSARAAASFQSQSFCEAGSTSPSTQSNLCNSTKFKCCSTTVGRTLRVMVRLFLMFAKLASISIHQPGKSSAIGLLRHSGAFAPQIL